MRGLYYNPVEQIDPLGLYTFEEWRDGVAGTSSTDISENVDFISLGGSAGAVFFAGTLTCFTAQFCIVN